MNPDPKIKTPRDRKYLDYIRSLPCVVCGCSSQAAHTGRGGIAIKASDYSCIPLCHEHHRLSHGIGQDSFARIYGLDYAKITARLQKKYTKLQRVKERTT